MKSLRFLLVLGFASLLTTAFVRAEDQPKADAPKCHGMACCKKKDKDGKASCAKEGHACCCDTGDKATDEKSEPKK